MAEVTNDHIKGIVLIFIVAVIWITASFIVQSIEGELHPVLLTFFCNTLFLIYFPLSILQHRRRCATCSNAACLRSPRQCQGSFPACIFPPSGLCVQHCHQRSCDQPERCGIEATRSAGSGWQPNRPRNQRSDAPTAHSC